MNTCPSHLQLDLIDSRIVYFFVLIFLKCPIFPFDSDSRVLSNSYIYYRTILSKRLLFSILKSGILIGIISNLDLWFKLTDLYFIIWFDHFKNMRWYSIIRCKKLFPRPDFPLWSPWIIKFNKDTTNEYLIVSRLTLHTFKLIKTLQNGK